MISMFRFLWLCAQAYSMARNGKAVAYVAQTRHGVPECAIFVGFGREVIGAGS